MRLGVRYFTLDEAMISALSKQVVLEHLEVDSGTAAELLELIFPRMSSNFMGHTGLAVGSSRLRSERPT